ncbi:unnamed protein product [Prorocentrum cordatum]|uniref:Phosphoglycerate mutase n=1 Tax=Prorocentrum cordatum TaxID=2364126 RepID=A0ABN9RMV4_9DINO|nr:unnamed protein product [Polarella glacialis]
MALPGCPSAVLFGAAGVKCALPNSGTQNLRSPARGLARSVPQGFLIQPSALKANDLHNARFTLGTAAFALALVNTGRTRRKFQPARRAIASCNASAPRMGVVALPPIEARCCNSGDVVAEQMPANAKVVWHFRHGHSTGNEAKAAARAADKGTGLLVHDEEYRANETLADAPLTEEGKKQALDAQQRLAEWQVKPELVVSSSLTRAIQTAAIMFEEHLLAGTMQLVIRPELREVHPDVHENSGRPVEELRKSPDLTGLPCYRQVMAALADDEAADWRADWDEQWARGSNGAWQAHVSDPQRLVDFQTWIAERSETRIATVSHWGTINNIMNREPWTEGLDREQVRDSWGPDATWPVGGIVRKFSLPNCGWVAVPLCEI